MTPWQAWLDHVAESEQAGVRSRCGICGGWSRRNRRGAEPMGACGDRHARLLVLARDPSASRTPREGTAAAAAMQIADEFQGPLVAMRRR